MTRAAWLLCSLALAGCGTSVAVKQTAAPTSGPANKQVAQRDAERLLDSVVLPAGSVRLTQEPHGDGRLLHQPPQWSSGALVDLHGWWRSPGALPSAIAFVKSHPPAGSKLTQFGQQGGPGVPRNHTLGFSMPAVQGVTSSRIVLFNLVALRGGGTGIRVDAQEVWLLPRPASERIPAGVREIDVSSGRLPGYPRPVSREVTAPAKVRKIIGWVNQMLVVQPGATSCPPLPAAPVVSFGFRTRAGGRLLAQAKLDEYPYSNACNPVTLTIRGVRQKPLLGGDFLSRVGRLLGVRFH